MTAQIGRWDHVAFAGVIASVAGLVALFMHGLRMLFGRRCK